MNTNLKEHKLDDDFPVYVSYAYVVDGRVVFSPVSGEVRDLRRAEILEGKTAEIVTTCDLVGRGYFDKKVKEEKFQTIDGFLDSHKARSFNKKPQSSKTAESRKKKKKKHRKKKK